jgi:steroid delta-isomerase-like uncharacterized protein
MSALSSARIAARCELVDEHVRLENRHDLAGVMRTFGAIARYDDEPCGEHHVGSARVQAYYSSLFTAMPDLHIEICSRHVSETAIVLEVVITGRHHGTWRGLPATGRAIEFPLCGIFTFDDTDRLSGERIYYDRASVLRQLGVFHEPERLAGRLNVLLMHPLTLAGIAFRKLAGSRRKGAGHDMR